MGIRALIQKSNCASIVVSMPPNPNKVQNFGPFLSFEGFSEGYIFTQFLFTIYMHDIFLLADSGVYVCYLLVPFLETRYSLKNSQLSASYFDPHLISSRKSMDKLSFLSLIQIPGHVAGITFQSKLQITIHEAFQFRISATGFLLKDLSTFFQNTKDTAIYEQLNRNMQRISLVCYRIIVFLLQLQKMTAMQLSTVVRLLGLIAHSVNKSKDSSCSQTYLIDDTLYHVCTFTLPSFQPIRASFEIPQVFHFRM